LGTTGKGGIGVVQAWKKVLQWKAPFAKWFVGGQTNVSVNCLD
jgi:acetyl-CoA synthetase